MKATVPRPKAAERPREDAGRIAAAHDAAAPARTTPPYDMLAGVRERRNATGMPDAVKADLEARAGASLDEVRVTYGSGEPARFGALAFACGPHVHLGPGEERRLPHEIAHVVQQRAGRAAPDGIEGGVPVTGSPALEREADLFAQGRGGLPRPGSVCASPTPTLQFVKRPGSQGHMSVQTLRSAYRREYDLLVVAVREAPPTFSSEGIAKVRLGNKVYEITEADHRDLLPATSSVMKAAAPDPSASSAPERKAVVASPGAFASPEEEEEGSRALPGDRAPPAFGGLVSSSAPGSSSLASEAESKEAAQLPAPATSSDAPGLEASRRRLREQVHDERKTRVGFEIELGLSVTVPWFEGFERFINLTLLDYAHPAGAQGEGGSKKTSALTGGVLLEALLDDPHAVDAKGRKIMRPDEPPAGLQFQIEFRSKPLPPEFISADLKASVVGAIEALSPAKMFERMGSQERDASGWAGAAAGAAFLAAAQPKGAEDGGRGGDARGFTLTDLQKAKLVQHVTSSLNLRAYVAMPREGRKRLYQHGVEARSIAGFYGALTARLGDGRVNARTGARNTEEQTIKSPLESMIAAEFATGISRTPTSKALGGLSGAVDVGGGKSHPIPPLQETVDSIVRSGAFPMQQGRDLQGRKVDRKGKAGGYLAIADKLQTPLFDPRNTSLRVLVEHRTDDIVEALNAVMAGKKDDRWTHFVKAMRAMDELAEQQGESDAAHDADASALE